jgi:hypothetical protein
VGSELDRVVGRTLLQIPAGLLLGFGFGYLSAFPLYLSSFVACGAGNEESSAEDCVVGITYTGIALSATAGVGLGVGAMGALLNGRGRFGPALGGAAVGAAVGLGIAFASGATENKPFVINGLVGATLGATLAYAIFDALASERTSAAARLGDTGPSVQPVLGATRSGGLVGGLVGRF